MLEDETPPGTLVMASPECGQLDLASDTPPGASLMVSPACQDETAPEASLLASPECGQLYVASYTGVLTVAICPIVQIQRLTCKLWVY